MSASRPFRHALSLAFLAGLSLASSAGIGAEPARVQVLIYDGQKYPPQQLEQVARTPTQMQSPSYSSGSSIHIPRSPDGHYRIHGFINGAPVLWLVDTGATTSAIPTSLARNCGIRAAIATRSETAGGVVRSGLSDGNQLTVGGVAVENQKLAILDELSTPILGMNVLARFQMVIDNSGMRLTPQRP